MLDDLNVATDVATRCLKAFQRPENLLGSSSGLPYDQRPLSIDFKLTAAQIKELLAIKLDVDGVLAPNGHAWRAAHIMLDQTKKSYAVRTVRTQ